MKRIRSILVAAAAALALFSMPVVAYAQPAVANCLVIVAGLCVEVSLAVEPLFPAESIPAANELSPAELQYHRESTARMDLPGPMGYAAPAGYQLSAAELQYHRESTARTDLILSVESVAPAVYQLSAAELQYHRESTARRDLY